MLKHFNLLTILLIVFLRFHNDAELAIAQGDILFVRGADRSGGFLEANNDGSRTEHLADINRSDTFGGNHGWGELADLLRSEGFELDQVSEPIEQNAPGSGPTTGAQLDFSNLTTGKSLTEYDTIVFGSNNAVYDSNQIDLVENYIRGGGGALFISDANFGGNWGDAPASDQLFLDRFGIEVLQDQGTYSLTRAAGDFYVPDHPLFENVNRFDGEGVSPFRIIDANLTDGVSATILANAEGNVRNNDRLSVGSSRSADENDAAVFFATADLGRIVGHFDRNTFFNLNGAGTNLNRFDNAQYAVNLFNLLATTVEEPQCDANTMGDLNADGLVGFDDFLVLSGNFGQAVASHTFGDIDCDGSVAFADFLTLSANFGTTSGALPASVQTVPEPNAGILVAVTVTILSVKRRRKTGTGQ